MCGWLFSFPSTTPNQVFYFSEMGSRAAFFRGVDFYDGGIGGFMLGGRGGAGFSLFLTAFKHRIQYILFVQQRPN